MHQVNKMLELVYERHANQYDKGGAPYVYHAHAVYWILRTKFGITPSVDPDLCCTALGHDLIEDTDLSTQDLIDMGFSLRVVDGILTLTKYPLEGIGPYLERIKEDAGLIKIKICDLEHNMDLSRIASPTQKDLDRVEVYRRRKAELEAHLMGHLGA